MSEQQVRDVMMRYLDGEASPDEVEDFERQLGESTELRRELALYRSLKDDFSTLDFRGIGEASMWDRVSRQLGQPIGWVLMIGGMLIWLVFGTYLYLTSDTALWEKLATSAVAIGALALLSSIGWESYRAWLVDPYKDVHR